MRPSLASARAHAPLAVLAVATVVAVVPTVAPGGVVALGVCAGAVIALHAIATVLVNRTSGFLAFLQVGFAAFLGSLYSQLAARRQPLVWLHDACSCLTVPKADGAALAAQLPPEARGFDLARLSDAQLAALAQRGPLVGTATVLSLLAVAALGALGGVALYALVFRRLRAASPLASTVVSVGLGQGFLAGAGAVGGLFGGGNAIARSPIPGTFHVSGVVVSGADVAKVVIAVAAGVGLALVLRAGRLGLRVRAAAEAPERAATLGVDVDRVTRRSWALVGALAAAAGVLEAVTAASGVTGAAGSVRVLLPVVVAGAASVPIAAVAGLLVGVLQQGVVAQVAQPATVQGVLFAVVVVALLVTPIARRRADRSAALLPDLTDELRPIPAALRSLPEVRRALRVGAGLLVLAVAVGPLLLSPSQRNQASVAVSFAIVGLSLLIVTGWAGQLSLGQFGVAAVGAWAAASSGLPFLPALLLGVLAGAVTSVAIAVPALRLPGSLLAVASLAFASAVPGVLLNRDLAGGRLPRALGRPSVLGVDFASEGAWFALCLTILVACVGVVVGLRRSRGGRVLLALRDNEAAAAAHGVDALGARVGGLAVAGGLAGLGGVLYAHTLFGVSSEAFAPDVSLDLFLVAVVGGLGAAAGPVVGAFGLALLTFTSSSDVVRLLGTGLAAVVVVLIVPGGLVRALAVARDAWLRQLAARRGIVVEGLTGQAAVEVGVAPIRARHHARHGVAEVPRYAFAGQWQADPTSGVES